MKILYICTGNCFRSPVAEALTKKYRPEFETKSAGVNPADHIAQGAQDLLRDRGALDLVKEEPDSISKETVDSAERIIVMESNHKEHLYEKFEVDGKEVECWNVADPVRPDVDPEKTFREIEEKIKAM